MRRKARRGCGPAVQVKKASEGGGSDHMVSTAADGSSLER